MLKTDEFGALLDVQMSFCVAVARDLHLVKSEQNVRVCSISKNDRICRDAFSVAGAIQETCLSEMLGGPGADFLRRVAFWSIGSSGLLRRFCVTGATLRMTWPHFFVAGAAL